MSLNTAHRIHNAIRRQIVDDKYRRLMRMLGHLGVRSAVKSRPGARTAVRDLQNALKEMSKK